MESPESSLAVVIIFSSLVFAYAFFVMAVASISRGRIRPTKTLEEQSGLLGGFVRQVFERVDYYLLSCQLGMFMSALLGSWMTFELFKSTGLEKFAESYIGPINMQTWAGLLSALLASFLVTLLALSIVRVLKSLAVSQYSSVLTIMAPFIVLVVRLLAPLTYVVDKIGSLLVRILNLDRALDHDFAVSAEEIAEIAEQSSEAGEIEEDELEMIQGVFTFSDTTVQEVMTPRKDIATITEGATLSELVNVFQSEKFSRLLVIAEDIDHVRGVLIAKDLLPLLGKDIEHIELKKLIRPAYFVPETKKIDNLLDELRTRGVHLAVVLDEHGAVSGVVTMEDIIEEIFGEIFDESDIPADEIDVKRTDSGDLLVDGGTLIDDLNREHGYEFPKGEYKTFAGFIFHHLGRVPTKSEVIEYHGLKIRVDGLDQNRITQLRIIKSKGVSPRSVKTPKEGESIKKAEPQTPASESNLWGKKQLEPASSKVPVAESLK